MKSDILEIKTMPVVPLRGLILFPGMNLHFDIGRKTSLAAVKAAGELGSELFFLAQRDADQENPTTDDMLPVGVVGTVRQIVRLPDHSGTLRVVVEGSRRGRIFAVKKTLPYMNADVELLRDYLTLPPEAAEHAEIFEEAALYSVKQ